jgi:hypothetical protein
VDVGDVLGTIDGGRARVELLDNTIFDLGIATTLSLMQHDPDRHSTELDLHAGRLHADIGAADGSQPSFQVRTPIVQISAAPTMLFVSANPKEATVCSAGSGPVTVRNSSGASVTLAVGQCSITRAGEAVGPPRSDPARLEHEMALAIFEAGRGAPGLAHDLAVNQALTATNAGVALLNVVALIEIQHATSEIKKVRSSPDSLTSTFGALLNDANAAAQAAHNFCLALLDTTFGQVPSPSVPISECTSAGP